jgi:iron uptake system component EfeO
MVHNATRRRAVTGILAAGLILGLAACSSVSAGTDGGDLQAGSAVSDGSASPSSGAGPADTGAETAGAGSGPSGAGSSGSGSSGSGSSGSAPAAGDASAAPVSDGAAQVTITLADNTCTLDFTAAPAGPVTFTVTNVSASGLTEVELRQDQRIIGEKENLAPGLPAVSFTSTLDGGTYEVYCPGADTERQELTISGTAPTAKDQSVAALLAAGTATYAQYVSGVVADMVTAVQNLQAAIDGGDRADAQAKYALARPFYEKIESDVEGFVLPGFSADENSGFLDYLIDMRASNLDPAVGWHGFHAIERDLFGSKKITGDTKDLAAELVKNVKSLADLSKTLTYQPEDLANGASGLLEEVQSNKIKGEEEAFSHLDLVDFAANVEGAEQAFANLQPGLEKIDSGLTRSITTRFAAVDKALDKYRDPADLGGFVRWTAELRATDAAALSKVVQALQDPLSQIAQKVATV